MTHHLTYLEAVVTGLVQGVTELFPVSSLGHNVLLPALIGGSWASALNVSAPNSPYLAFIVGLHVATAIAMIAYFWRDWLRIVRGFVSSVAQRRVETADERLAWFIILGTIPVGIVGVLVQKEFTKVFAKPELAALFLAVNGVILLVSERMRRMRVDGAAAAAVAAGSGDAGPGVGAGGRPGGARHAATGGPGYAGQEYGGPGQEYGGPGQEYGGPGRAYPQPPQGYQQQPRQQHWQGPRYGDDDWQRDQYGQDDQGRDPWGDQHGAGGGAHGRRPAQYGNQHGQTPQPEHDQYGQDQYGQDQYGQDQYGRSERYGQEQYRRDPRGGQPERAGQQAQGQGQDGSRRQQAQGQDGLRRQQAEDQDAWARQQAQEGPDAWARQQAQGQDAWTGQQAQGQDAWAGQQGRGAWDAVDPRGDRGRQTGGRDPRDPRGGRDSWDEPDRRAAASLASRGGSEGDPAVAADRRLSAMGTKQALLVGASQILALLPGISRDGIVTVAGMGRGLSREDAVRFSFLLSAPVILAAGVLKVGDLAGPMGKGIHGPVLVGSLIAGIGAYVSIRFLTKYFSENKSLNPFGIYCLIAGLGSLAYLVL